MLNSSKPPYQRMAPPAPTGRRHIPPQIPTRHRQQLQRSHPQMRPSHTNSTIRHTNHPQNTAAKRTQLSTPVQTHNNDAHKSFQINIDKQSGRLMMLVTLAFLIFYVLVVSSKLFADYNNSKNTARSEHQTHTRNDATHISTAINNSIIWINNGLSEGANPAQAARLITKSPQISATVILDAKNRIIAQEPSTAGFLSKTSLKGIKGNKFEITSIIAPNGSITPIIIKKTGNYFTVAALATNALLSKYGKEPSFSKTALISSSGRAIDGDAQLGTTGAQDWYNLSNSDFKRITMSVTTIIESLKITNTNYRLVSVRIPNSDLILLQAKPKTEASILKSNITLFTILFFGICLVAGLLLNSLYKQLRSTRNIQQQTEISQQRYQAAVEGDRGGIWELDIPNNNAYISASLSNLLGLPRQEHLMPIPQFLNLFHPNERDKFFSIARRAHVQGEFDVDVTVAHLPMILQCRGRPSTRSDRGFKRVIVGVALDITEQRNSQKRLKAAEARLHNALSSMTNSFIVWDNMNRLVLWNIKFEDFFGLEPNTLKTGLDHANVAYLAQPAIAETIVHNDNSEWAEMKLKDGRWIRYIETPTAEGGRVSIGTDITEIRMREAELSENSAALKNTVDVLRKSQDRIFELAEGYEQEKIRAEEANQSKTDFLASMSHELRTPLNAINGFSDIMKKEMFGPLGDPRYKEYIGDILFSGQHLLALINDILDMSKIEAGKMSLNTEIIFMHEMIAQVGRIIRGRAEEAQLNLDISTQDVHEIEADPRAVKQILINLLTNAIKFTPVGGTVGIELVEKKTGIVIKVKDSGIGISADNIDRLAKPIEQVIDTDNKHKEGTGLGLALSKSLIELHGGNFKIESVLGEGTTVIFSLPNTPIRQAEEPNNHDVRQEISRLAQDIAEVLADDENRDSAKDTNTNPYVQAHTPPNPQNVTAPPPMQAPNDRTAA